MDLYRKLGGGENGRRVYLLEFIIGIFLASALRAEINIRHPRLGRGVRRCFCAMILSN